ncbi:hypothetical protein PAHAL_6G304600 [Panicum hallii]|uniref:Fe2OG dioxygenase domain-containing protein n=1 Tax=Panicum hallii TaxID=206008 RepID=A0A2S3I4U5_9POAL|nr:protein DMR6-LIKE OXYGENASE 2-like [Panicum hallii]PAN36716.1 hypothetical protein PAHAL_6G304600 [Panicum hallii]
MSLVAAPMTIVDLATSAQLQQQQQAMEVEEDAKAEQQELGAGEQELSYSILMKGVRHLSDSGITRLPDRYVLPAPDRPGAGLATTTSTSRVKLPVVDLARLRDPSQRAAVLQTLDAACRGYGFFQVVNHGVDGAVIAGMLDVALRFFELPLPERARYMSPDVRAAVRYGTSFNQAKDAVLCWRDFLKLVCHPLRDVVAAWPREPAELRDVASGYAAASHGLFMELMEAALQALGIAADGGVLGELAAGSSHMMTVNCYPACPQPELTLGMPAHSDYGLFTFVLQDHVEGLQVMHGGRWLTVDPIPGSFVVNVGDHLEIYSNGAYKSVLHRVRVNSTRPRISVASFHSLPAERVVGPAPELVDEAAGKPRRYMDTDFATFLAYLASADGKDKTFLQSRMLLHGAAAAASSIRT